LLGICMLTFRIGFNLPQRSAHGNIVLYCAPTTWQSSSTL
jgi:hypothetical protein